MKDAVGRTITYMRISITDRCNLRCRYCMPNGIETVPMGDLLTYEEILEVCREAVSLGITRFKITGGEPLVRKGCCELIGQIKALPGVEEVTLTTNGILLDQYLPALLQAGIDGVNISLDTLRRDRYQEITKFDQLPAVLRGIETCAKAGVKTKVNCVLQRGANDDEWEELLVLARDRKIDVRFIELMPIGEGRIEQGIPGEELLERIRSKYPNVTEDSTVHGNGPAKYYRIPGFKGSVGFISAVHGIFCASCNRIRMTSTGDIKPCLCYGDHVSLRETLRSGDEDRLGQVRALLQQAIWKKPEMHCFSAPQEITENKKMAQIGG